MSCSILDCDEDGLVGLFSLGLPRLHGRELVEIQLEHWFAARDLGVEVGEHGAELADHGVE